MTRSNETTESGETIVLIRLSQIEIMRDFNARLRLDATVGGTQGENGFAGIIESIASKSGGFDGWVDNKEGGTLKPSNHTTEPYHGQDTPIIVRPSSSTKGGFQLVAGHQRRGAIAAIAKSRKIADPFIKAIVKELDDREAMLLNLRENTARDSLGAPDLLYQCARVAGWGKGIKTPAMSGNRLASELGLNQSYVAKLQRICTNVSPDILAKWREMTRPVSTADMDRIGKIEDPAEQRRAFELAQAAKGGNVGSGNGAPDPNAWVEAAKRRAAEMGTLIAKLEQLRAITGISDDFFETPAAPAEGQGIDGENVLVLLLGASTFRLLGKNVSTAAQRESIARAAHRAYEQAHKDAKKKSEKGERESTKRLSTRAVGQA